MSGTVLTSDPSAPCLYPTCHPNSNCQTPDQFAPSAPPTASIDFAKADQLQKKIIQWSEIYPRMVNTLNKLQDELKKLEGQPIEFTAKTLDIPQLDATLSFESLLTKLTETEKTHKTAINEIAEITIKTEEAIEAARNRDELIKEYLPLTTPTMRIRIVIPFSDRPLHRTPLWLNPPRLDNFSNFMRI